MATVVCTLPTLRNQAKCFSCFSQLENQAAIVYFLEGRRAKLAGTAAKNAFQLRQDTACFACTPVDPVADNLDAAIAQAGAVAANVTGASTQTITQIRAAIKALANVSLDDLRTMEIAIRCALNAFP
jgi:hypothetical protein